MHSSKLRASVRCRAWNKAVEKTCGGLTLHNWCNLKNRTKKLFYNLFMNSNPCFRQPFDCGLLGGILFLGSHELSYFFSSPTF